MPLPEIVTPTYTLAVPSTKKKIKYRPFLVKEQKTLIVALETEDQEMIYDAIVDVLESCISSKIDLDELSLFCLLYTSPSPRD